jgi:hypothetical protein
MDKKTTFLNSDLKEEHGTTLRILRKEANILCVSFTSFCMARNNLQEHITESRMHFFKELNL